MDPIDKPLEMFHIRITGGEDEKWKRLYIQNFKRYFVVTEEADEEVNRTHTHAHVEEPLYQVQTVRNKLSEMTNKNKDKVFSMKGVRDREKNLTYLCKGKALGILPIVYLNNLLTPEQILYYHELYWQTQLEWIKEHAKKPKIKQKTFLELCIDESAKEEYAEKWKGDFEYITNYQKRAMFMLVTSMLGSKRKILDAMIIRRLCNGVFNVIMPLKYRDDMLFESVYPDNVRLE